MTGLRITVSRPWDEAGDRPVLDRLREALKPRACHAVEARPGLCCRWIDGEGRCTEPGTVVALDVPAAASLPVTQHLRCPAHVVLGS